MADHLPSQGNYWYAEEDEDRLNQKYRWMPTLQMEGMVTSLRDVHFSSKEDCDAFIEEDIIGAGHDA